MLRGLSVPRRPLETGCAGADRSSCAKREKCAFSRSAAGVKGFCCGSDKLLLPEADLVGWLRPSPVTGWRRHPDVKDGLFRCRAQDRDLRRQKSSDLVVSLGTLHNLKIFDLQTRSKDRAGRQEPNYSWSRAINSSSSSTCNVGR